MNQYLSTSLYEKPIVHHKNNKKFNRTTKKAQMLQDFTQCETRAMSHNTGT